MSPLGGELDPELFPVKPAPSVSQTPVLDAINSAAKAEVSKGDHVDAGLTFRDGEVGIAAGASKAIGKGWTVAGAVSWAKQVGWAAAGYVGWRPAAPKPEPPAGNSSNE